LYGAYWRLYAWHQLDAVVAIEKMRESDQRPFNQDNTTTAAARFLGTGFKEV
jgi:hypothetical protein